MLSERLMKEKRINIENMAPSLNQLVSEMGDAHVQPVKVGPVYLRQTGISRKVRVLLSIYTTPYEHYAVISQERLFCSDCGFLNLKHCTGRALNSADGSFNIVAKDGDKGSLTITPLRPEDTQDWLKAVNREGTERKISKDSRSPLCALSSQTMSIPRRPLMPTLTEEALDE